MLRQIGVIISLAAVLFCVTACAGFEAEISGGRAVSGSAASGSAVRDVAQKQKTEKTKKRVRGNYITERKNITKALHRQGKRQINTICKEKDKWYTKGKIRYALTDFDQDGCLEIFVVDQQGRISCFEYREDSEALRTWQTPEESFDFSENPMCVFFDAKTGVWHLDVAGGEKSGATDRARIRYDLAVKDHSMNAVEYKDAEKQFQGMEKAYMCFDLEEIDSDEECLDDLSYREFWVEKALDLTDMESRLSVGEKEQLRVAAREIDKDFIRDKSDFSCGRYYAITDFDRDGGLECLVATMFGSGMIRSFYSLYEVSEAERGLFVSDCVSGGGTFGEMGLAGGFVIGGIGEKVAVWQEKKTGQYDYVFDAGEAYEEERGEYQFTLNRHCFEMTEKNKKIRETAEKRPDIYLKWVNQNPTACEDYRYENLLISWLGFGESQ